MKDLRGEKFGRLTVIEEAERAPKSNKRQWRCICSCDEKNERIVVQGNLVTGTTKSCGCIKAEEIRKRFENEEYATKVASTLSKIRKTHGMSRTPTYNSWRSMIDRCYNPNKQYYSLYGGRGITVCKRWKDSFEAFLEDMGERPKGMELDRIDVNGGYELSNCRWITHKEQCNNRSITRRLTFDGKTLTIAQWSERTKIPERIIRSRLYSGWGVEKVLTQPVRKITKQ